MKPENPYNRLKRKSYDLVWSLLRRDRRHVLTYTGVKDGSGVTRTLFDYAHALDKAGFDVVLKPVFEDGSLKVEAVKRPDTSSVPYWLE